ncbi:MAG: tetratricopeptide repeat protein [Leptolyngbyaceae cyanobacterium]
MTANVLTTEYPLDAVHSWVNAAVLYSQLGREQQANEAFAAAKESTEALTAHTLGEAQAIIVGGYVQLGDFEQASQLAAAIESSRGSIRAYSDIAAAHAKAGAVEEANRVAQSTGMDQLTRLSMMRAYLETKQYEQAQQIATQPDMIDHLPEIGQAYCAAGQPEQVVASIELLELNPEPADWLRSCAAISFAKQQQFNRATAIADTITSTDSRADTLIAIAIQHNTSASSFWTRWVQRLPSPFQTLLGSAPDDSEAVELLDQAHDLIQS